MSRFIQWTVVLALFGLAAFILSLPDDVMPVEARHGGALAAAGIALWATGLVAEHITALIFFAVAMVFEVAGARTVFSGFASPALWMLFSGSIIGAAVQQTGLGSRIANAISRRFGASYSGVLLGIMLVAVILTFLMPSSTGRMVLLMPISLSLATAFGFSHGQKGYTGIVMITALSVFLLGFGILPANVPNLVMLGAADTIQNTDLVYGEYLLLHYPVLSLLKAVVIFFAVRFMFPDEVTIPTDGQADSSPMSRDEKMLILIICATLVLWTTDFWHGISPAWVALGGAIACLLPPFRLINPDETNKITPMRPLLYIGGILSLGAVVAETGFADHAAQAFLAVADLQQGEDTRNFFVIVLASLGISVLGTAPTVPVVMMPLAAKLAAATGLSLGTIIMMQPPAFSTVLLPFQGPPIVIGMQLGKVRIADGVKVTMVVGLISLLVLLPLDYLWWQALGMFDAAPR